MDDTRLALSDVRGPLKDLLDKLDGLNGTQWLARLKKFNRGEEVPVWEGRLLKLVTIVTVPAFTRFVARDHFKVDMSPEAMVRINCLGDNFTRHFLGKTETDVPATTLCIHRLAKPSLDAPIIAALGDRHETMLAQLWVLLSCQPRGENGILLTNGYANIFYIRDVEGTLWVVFAVWDGVGWNVSARSVEGPFGWSGDAHVFSCDS